MTINKYEQEYLDGLGTWHESTHLTREQLLEKYRDFEEGKDLAYISARNKLIPEAEYHANKTEGVKRGPKQTSEEFAERWSRCFRQKMNILWASR